MILQPINLQNLGRLLILKTHWWCPMWIFPLWLYICLAFCLQVVLRRLSRRRKSRESAFVTTLRVYDSGIRVKSKPKRKLDRVTQSFTHIFNHNNKDPANGPELEYEVSTVYIRIRESSVRLRAGLRCQASETTWVWTKLATRMCVILWMAMWFSLSMVGNNTVFIRSTCIWIYAPAQRHK